MDTARGRALVGRFAGASILIVGDVMLDQFVVGRVERISPEAPVPVVLFDHDEYRLGGAANVAHGVLALGGRPVLVGAVGADEAGERLMAELRGLGIDSSGLRQDQRRPTTRKLRIVTLRNQQVARVDYETDAEADGSVESALGASAERAAGAVAVIVISDYLKGVVTRELVARLVAAGRARGTPVLVDPKIAHLDYYADATLVTPNHHEAEAATHMRIRTADEARTAARALRARLRCESVLMTRGEQGMWLLDGSCGPDGTASSEYELPAVAREVADVTGAGDTVIATLALGLAAGARLSEAAELANHAAGIVVGKFGPSTVSREELLAALGGSS